MGPYGFGVFRRPGLLPGCVAPRPAAACESSSPSRDPCCMLLPPTAAGPAPVGSGIHWRGRGRAECARARPGRPPLLHKKRPCRILHFQGGGVLFGPLAPPRPAYLGTSVFFLMAFEHVSPFPELAALGRASLPYLYVFFASGPQVDDRRRPSHALREKGQKPSSPLLLVRAEEQAAEDLREEGHASERRAVRIARRRRHLAVLPPLVVAACTPRPGARARGQSDLVWIRWQPQEHAHLPRACRPQSSSSTRRR